MTRLCMYFLIPQAYALFSVPCWCGHRQESSDHHQNPKLGNIILSIWLNINMAATQGRSLLPLLTTWADYSFLKSRLVFHMFYTFYSDILKKTDADTFAFINALFFKYGFTSILEAMLPYCLFAGRASEALSSPGTVGWADSPVSCIISSRTFVTDTTYTRRLQFVYFPWLFLLFY